MKRFHRAMSLALFVLSSLILIVELFRASGLGPRIALLVVLMLFCVIIERLYAKLSGHSIGKDPALNDAR